jgi:RHS repeat-associated protein
MRTMPISELAPSDLKAVKIYKGVSIYKVKGSRYWYVEFNSQGQIVPYVVAEGRKLVRVEPNNRYFLHADWLASTRLTTDAVGKVVDEDDYSPWGEDTSVASHSANTFRFAGSRIDRQTGLVYMSSRYYDPKLTRFISVDPIIPNIYVPQSLNHYSYALNDPVTLTDPTGLAPEGNILGRPQDITDDEVQRSVVFEPSYIIRDFPHPEVFPSSEPDYPPSAISEWLPYYRPPSTPPLVAARETLGEFQEDRRRENLLCGICHAPDPSTVHRGTDTEVKAYAIACVGIGAAPAAAAGVAVAAEVITADLVLQASVSLYQFAPRAFNFVLNVGAASVGVPTQLSTNASTAEAITVGRWMSTAEYEEMLATGRVVESNLGGVTSVSFPASSTSYANAPAGSVYVEFQISKTALGAVSETGWGKIFGPNSIFGKQLGISEMPEATNITLKTPK